MLNSKEFKLDIVNLKTFPHTTLNNVVEGKNGIIEFYNVPEDVYAISIDENTQTQEISKVKYWSIHRQRKIEIVNLDNGAQIITDDDPRAVLGVTYKNYKKGIIRFDRFTPSQALEKEVMVPVLNKEKDSSLLFYSEIDLEALNKDIKTFDEALDYIRILKNNGVIAALTFKNKWKLYFPKDLREPEYFNKDISFAKVISIEKTGQYEDGYDLTVDGNNQNFLSSSGVILSNTINVHVPALPEAQRDLKEKLLPSKQIYGIRNTPKKGDKGEIIAQEEVVNKLKQDFISGMYNVNKAKPFNKWLFKTEKEALQAIKSGKVKLNDEVEILEK